MGSAFLAALLALGAPLQPLRAPTAPADPIPADPTVKRGVDLWQAGDYQAAIKAWRGPADRGDADAQFNLAQAYKLGRGVPADPRQAESWYRKAAEQGHQQAAGYLGLIMFQNGDRAGALPWIAKAADRGDPRAQYLYGTALFNGDIVAKDWPRAYALMVRAAAAGLPQAIATLHQMDQFIPAPDRERGMKLASEQRRAPPPPPRAPVRAPIRMAATPPRPVAGAGWRIQLGAFGTRAAAQGAWGTLRARAPALAGLTPFYQPAAGVVRLQVGPAPDRAAALRLCALAKASACFPVAP